VSTKCSQIVSGEEKCLNVFGNHGADYMSEGEIYELCNQ
jgi:hypothetical protein